jgi:hypothetical protein
VVEKFLPHGAKRGAAEVIKDKEKRSSRDRAILENMNNTVVTVVTKVTWEEVCISFLGVNRAIFEDVSKSLVGPNSVAEEPDIESGHGTRERVRKGVQVACEMRKVKEAKVLEPAVLMGDKVWTEISLNSLDSRAVSNNKAPINQGAFDLFLFEICQRVLTIPVEVVGTEKLHSRKLDIVGNGRRVRPNTRSLGVKWSMQVPRQVSGLQEAWEVSTLEECHHIVYPRVTNRGAETTQATRCNQLAVGPGAAVVRGSVAFDEPGQDLVGGKRNAEKLVDVGEQRKNENIDDDNAILDADLGKRAPVRGKPASDFLHWLSVGVSRGDVPSKRDPEVRMGVDNPYVRPSGLEQKRPRADKRRGWWRRKWEDWRRNRAWSVFFLGGEVCSSFLARLRAIR